MKIVVFGATGMIGQRIVSEALDRGHVVVAIARDPSKITQKHQHLLAVAGDVLDTPKVTEQIAGADAVVSAISPSGGSDDIYQRASDSLIKSLNQAQVRRIVFVGGAGSLYVAPGVQLVDTPDFPEIYKSRALAMREELNHIRTNAGELDWTYISPSALIHPGERTGKYRLGEDQLLVGPDGQSYISAEDYAVALIDELERGEHKKKRITVGY